MGKSRTRRVPHAGDVDQQAAIKAAEIYGAATVKGAEVSAAVNQFHGDLAHPNEGASARGDDGPVFLMSACFAGTRCAYDGGAANQEVPVAELSRVRLACPEVLGGLPTPRDRAEIVGGNGFDVLDGRARVLTHKGEDVTEAYLSGARQVLQIARSAGAAGAVLQDYSPACGCRQISDGTFRRNRVTGMGVTAALLAREGFAVVAHPEYDPATSFPGGSDVESGPAG